MKRIVIEKFIVYTLSFICLITYSLNQGTLSATIEKNFLENTESIMRSYNYVKNNKYPVEKELTYEQGDNIVQYKYNINPKKIKIKNLYVYLQLNYIDDLNNIYLFLNKLYPEDVSVYSNEIQKMINNYNNSKEKQMFQDLNNNRQVTLRIEKTTSIGKDYQLYYSIFNIER